MVCCTVTEAGGATKSVKATTLAEHDCVAQDPRVGVIVTDTGATVDVITVDCVGRTDESLPMVR